MAEVDVSAAWANKMSYSLLAQRARSVEISCRQELERRQRTWHQRSQGMVGLLLLLVSLALFVGNWDAVLNRALFLGALVAAPALAGTAASLIRRLWEQSANDIDKPDGSVMITGLLGCAAGTIAGLLYGVAQLATVTPSASGTGTMPTSASRLVPFALLTGFLAGFAADAFFRKMRDREVTSIEVPAFKAGSAA